MAGLMVPMASAQVSIAIDSRDGGRVFEGIGNTSAGGAVSRLLISYPEPQRSQILDYLFKPKYGASLQMLKVEIGGDGNSTEGSEPSHMHTREDENYNRGVELWLAEEARRRNPEIKLIALAWTFPAWVKRVDSDDTLNYLVNFLEGARRVHHLDFDYIGFWNESKYSYDILPRLRRALDARHLRTQIIADDYVNDWKLAEEMRKSPELYKAVDVMATHYPRFQSTETARNLGKRIWSSEDGPWSDAWAQGGSQSPPYAEVLNRNYIEGKMTATGLWCLVTSYYDVLDVPYAGLLRADTPWSGHYEVMSPVWVVAHTTQFAQPGWKYLDHASALLPGGGSYVTLKHGEDFSTIFETLSASSPQWVELSIDPAFHAKTLHVWRTNQHSSFEELPSLALKRGKVSLLIEPDSIYSITTTTGQHKGDAMAPPPAPFPVPYTDSFESYTVGDTNPRHIIEQNGSYEVAACAASRAGKCLHQVVDVRPVAWDYTKADNPLGTAAVLGDKLWSNYRVSADVYLDEPGYARVMGRVSRLTEDGDISGYQLYLYSEGKWELRTATHEGVIAAGRLDFPVQSWHKASLAFSANQITASFDGKVIADNRNDLYVRGMAGFGNGWNTGQYDNLEIAPVAGAELFSAPESRATTKPPAAPELFVPTPANHAVRLTWSQVEGSTGYRIKFGTAKGAYASTVDAGLLNGFTITTLTNGKPYFFAVSAYNISGESPVSNEQSALPYEPQ
jgi:hypothetical protein